jgi:hypothetical protein
MVLLWRGKYSIELRGHLSYGLRSVLALNFVFSSGFVESSQVTCGDTTQTEPKVIILTSH